MKPAKSEWWIEGVPTAALDYATNPPYLAITVNGVAGVHALPVEVRAQDVTELGTFPLGTAWDAESPLYLPGVTNGWTVSGLPPGLKYTPKFVTKANKKGKKVVSVTTNALPYSVYGKTTVAGLFTVTAKKKVNAQAARSTSGGSSKTGSLPVYYETMKYRMLVTPKAPDAAVFGDDLTNITTMAYVPVEWDLTGGSRSVATETFTCSNVVAKYSYKAKEKVKGKWKTVTKTITRTFALTVSPVPVVPDVPDVPIRGFATLVEAARSASGPYQAIIEIDAWQNLWGTTYKAAGKRLFYTSKKKPYKTFAYSVYTNETGGVSFIKNGVAALPGLAYFASLSLKVTPSGAVTATLSYGTGKTKKDPKTKKTVKVIYKPTCATVVIPTTAADAYQFLSGAYLFFAPSAGNSFRGLTGWVQVTE